MRSRKMGRRPTTHEMETLASTTRSSPTPTSPRNLPPRPTGQRATRSARRSGSKKKAEREAEEEVERKQRAELELLMADDDVAGDGGRGARVRHFDMKEIEKAERQARKKGKKGTSKTRRGGGDDDGENGDDFKLDAADPRFARLFSSHEYAIDPTNPKFKGTKGMKTLLEEGRKRRQSTRDQSTIDGTHERGPKDGSRQSKASGNGDVKSLVEKIKRQSKK